MKQNTSQKPAQGQMEDFNALMKFIEIGSRFSEVSLKYGERGLYRPLFLFFEVLEDYATLMRIPEVPQLANNLKCQFCDPEIGKSYGSLEEIAQYSLDLGVQWMDEASCNLEGDKPWYAYVLFGKAEEVLTSAQLIGTLPLD